MAQENAKNIWNEPLQQCGTSPMTGFCRDGFCHTGEGDTGRHVVAAIMTDEFLEYTKSKGNDLQTPRPEYGFSGLKSGDRWCLCALRWKEAYDAGVAPPVILEATHKKALEYIELEALKKTSTKLNITYKALSMAEISFLSSGSVVDPNESTNIPSLPIKNL